MKILGGVKLAQAKIEELGSVDNPDDGVDQNYLLNNIQLVAIVTSPANLPSVGANTGKVALVVDLNNPVNNDFYYSDGTNWSVVNLTITAGPSVSAVRKPWVKEDMTADKTLTPTSKSYQYLNPDADRKLILYDPSLGVNADGGLEYTIFNTATARNDILIYDETETVLLYRIKRSEIAKIHTTGDLWNIWRLI